jgi:HK97 family phage prohead protease
MDALEIRKTRIERAAGTMERRVYGLASPPEMRAAGGEAGGLHFEGLATVYDVEYEVYGGPPWGWIESVDQGAGRKTLSEKPDVVFLANHTGLPMARTKSGTLVLSEEAAGLRSTAPALVEEDPDVQRIRYKMARNDLDEMSYAFRVERQEWNEDFTRRWIREYNLHRGDVSIVTFGANSETSASLRAGEILRSLTHLNPEELMAEARGESTEVLRTAYEMLGQLLAPPVKTLTRQQALSDLELLSLQ